MEDKNKITNPLGNSQLDFNKNNKGYLKNKNPHKDEMVNSANNLLETDSKIINPGTARLDGDIDTI